MEIFMKINFLTHLVAHASGSRHTYNNDNKQMHDALMEVMIAGR